MDVLNGIRVVDLGRGMAPALITSFLTGAGAQATCIAAGDDPFAASQPACAVLRRKADRAGIDALNEVLAQADVCIIGGEDWPGMGAGPRAEDIAERFPDAVVLDIEAYPSGTQWAGRPAAEILAQARSGLVWEHYSDRPIAMSFNPAISGAALQGIIGVLAALYLREASGRGQIVRTSLFEGSLSWISLMWGKFENRTPANQFVMPKDPWPLVFRARDGKYVQIVMGSAGSKYKMYKALDIDDPSVQPGDSGMVTVGNDPKNFFGDIDVLARHVALQDSAPLLERIWSYGLPAEPALAPGECWDEPQVVHNGVIETAPDGTRHVGFPFRLTSSEATAQRAAPSGARPLDGVRAVDFGAFVAGPLSTAILAELGAEVIKVEPPTGDASRAMVRSFNTANRGKTGITLDLKDPGDIALALALCQDADLVSSNFRSGVSTRLGIDPHQLHARRADLVVLEAPAYGSSGPLADRAGFDMVMQALCGHQHKGGGSGNPPLWNRTSMVDLAGGLLGAAGALLGLLHRARTGHGAAVDSPLLNAGIFLGADLVQQADGRFVGPPDLNADLTGRHPAEALYEVAGGWIALVARGAAATQGLGAALGLDLPANPADWDVDEARQIAAALRPMTPEAARSALERAGVWVEECRRDAETEVLGDPDLQQLGTVHRSVHPEFGEVLEPGLLVRFSRSAAGSTRHTPTLGEANDEVRASYCDGQAG